MIDDRVERLLNKAEAAADRNDLDQSERFQYLASQAAWMRRRESKDLERMMTISEQAQ